MIDRLIRCTLQLDQLDDKLLGKNWTDLDVRTYGGLINRQRLLARELGLKAYQVPPPTLAELQAQWATKPRERQQEVEAAE